jgi:hypothetical protein
MAKGMSKKDLERLLTDTLIPVEPSQDFLANLQARLVTYRGRRALNGWMVFAVLATAALIAISALGLILRVFVALASLVSILINRRGSSSSPGMGTT